jgi:hypothetical protein
MVEGETLPSDLGVCSHFALIAHYLFVCVDEVIPTRPLMTTPISGKRGIHKPIRWINLVFTKNAVETRGGRGELHKALKTIMTI